MKPSLANNDQFAVRELHEFDQRSGSWAERILFTHRIWVVLVCAVLTVVFGTFAAKLRLNASFEDMIPTSHPFVANYLANKKELSGLGNVLRIAVENRKGVIFDAQYLESLKQLNDELFAIPGVDRPFVKSLWTPTARWTGVTEEGLDGGPIIPDDYDGSQRSLDSVRLNVERSGELGQLVAGNYRSSVIVVPLLDSSTGQRLDYAQLNERLETIRAKFESEALGIHITGFAKVAGDLIGGLKQVLAFFAAAIAICTAVIYFYTRCIRSTALVVIASLIAVVWLLGLLASMGRELDPYSILVPFLVFAIGMSHGAQKMNGIMQDIGRGAHRLVAARYTFRRLFMAGLTALLADAVGFAVLMIIDIQVIRDLAVAASMGVAALIFTNLILLPVLLSYVGVSKNAARRSVQQESGDATGRNWLRGLGAFTQEPYARWTVLSALVLGVLGFLVSLQLRIGDTDPGAPELRADSVYNQDNLFMVQNYAASSDIYVVMVKTPKDRCVEYAYLSRVDALETELLQLPGVESTQSYASLSKRLAVGMNEGSIKWFELPRAQDMLNTITSRAPREFFNYKCDLLTVYVYLKDHKADTLTSVVNAVEQFGVRNNDSEIQFLSAAGNAGIEAATNIVVRRANVQMLLLVYAAVTILAYVTFRSWRAVVCAVLPLMLTSVLCEALMVALGIGVKVATLPVIALGVGIGVDYALYVLSVTLAYLKQGMPLTEAYYRSLMFTGKVVVLTGLTLGIAVATWAFSPIKFQADMGILLAFMFVWNMVGALVLLPALARYLLQPQQANAPAATNAAVEPAAV